MAKADSGGAVLVTPRVIHTPRNLADVRIEAERTRVDVANLNAGEFFGNLHSSAAKSEFGLIANSHVVLLSCNRKELVAVLGREVVEKIKADYDLRVLYREERLSYITDEVQTEIVGMLSSKKKGKSSGTQSGTTQHTQQANVDLGATHRMVSRTPAPPMSPTRGPQSPRGPNTPGVVPKLRISNLQSAGGDMDTGRSTNRGPAPPSIPLSSRYPIA